MKEEQQRQTTTSNNFYENNYPEIDELVMCRIVEIDPDIGVECQLLEYNNLEGFLPYSQIYKRRMRSIFKYARKGQKQVLQVTKVDDKGPVELSRKYVNDADRINGKKKYLKGKTVQSIAQHVASINNKDVEDIKKEFIYPLYQKYCHAYDAFQALANKNENIFKMNNSDAKIKEDLTSIIMKRLSVPPFKVSAEVDLSCYAEGGIDEIKKAIKQGLKVGNDDKVSIHVVSSPEYFIWMYTTDEEHGKRVLNDVINAMKESITESKGTLSVVEAPYVSGKSNKLDEENEDFLIDNDMEDDDIENEDFLIDNDVEDE